MFVLSFKTSKGKLIILAAVIAAAVIAAILIPTNSKKASKSNAINYSAKNDQERIAFLSQFGWKVTSEPLEVSEIIIPNEFDAVYDNYNSIQTAQKLDLTKYRGQRVKRWTYEVLNYPGYESKKGCIHANLLIYNDRVIGGDICSVELNGFMHGFAKSEDKQADNNLCSTCSPEMSTKRTAEKSTKKTAEKSTKRSRTSTKSSTVKMTTEPLEPAAKTGIQ